MASSAKSDPAKNDPTSAEVELQLNVPPEKRPRHVAIIMDGNGRWAENQHLPRVRGHQQGAKTVRTITEECTRQGIEQLTLYCFSSENWKGREHTISIQYANGKVKLKSISANQQDEE